MRASLGTPALVLAGRVIGLAVDAKQHEAACAVTPEWPGWAGIKHAFVLYVRSLGSDRTLGPVLSADTDPPTAATATPPQVGAVLSYRLFHHSDRPTDTSLRVQPHHSPGSLPVQSPGQPDLPWLHFRQRSQLGRPPNGQVQRLAPADVQPREWWGNGGLGPGQALP